MEEYAAVVGDDKTRYFVVRRKNMRNMRMMINGNGEVVVSCSPCLAFAQINAFVLKNLDWIASKTKEIAARPKPEKRRYLTGEKFLFCGEECLLAVVRGDREKVEKVGGTLAVTVRDTEDFDKKRKLIDKWYKKNTEKVFRERFEYCLSLYRTLFPDIYTLRIRRMKARWGSCMINKKTVVLNSQLIYADIKYLDYVILHELCHFYFKNHDKDFYGLLAKLSPDFKTLRKSLTNYYISYTR